MIALSKAARHLHMMNQQEIKKILDELTGEIDSIADKKAVGIIKILINLVEILAEENARCKKTIQQQKDEISRLKGEQGKPNIRKQKSGDIQGKSNHSSEKNRKKKNKNKNKKAKKKPTVKIDRQVKIEFDKSTLPPDAVFKGYETRIIQDLKITTDNIEFQLPTYYSKSLKKSFIAPMPDAYKGSEFGPGIKSIVITFYRDGGMTIPAIERFLETFGISISRSTLSRFLIEGHDDFHHEKEAIFNAGMQAYPYQHLDDTGCRVNGKNHYAHVFCNPLFTAYYTRQKKNRLTLLEILCRDELKYKLDQQAFDFMMEFGLAKKWRDQIKPLLQESDLTRTEMDEKLLVLFPNQKKHSTNRRRILEAAALAYYQQSNYVVNCLMTDDAPQFKKLSLHHALCWIHEGRHYKKLTPISTLNRRVLDGFLDEFWTYYDTLLTYKQQPSERVAQQLSMKFDELFSTVTGYEFLDKRIAMTREKKDALLQVLTHPFLPIENNPAELGARVQTRIRDINLQTISTNGTKSKDTFATIVQTARKLGVNIYQYIYDRVSQKFEMSSLAELILIQSQEMLNTT